MVVMPETQNPDVVEGAVHADPLQSAVPFPTVDDTGPLPNRLKLDPEMKPFQDATVI